MTSSRKEKKKNDLETVDADHLQLFLAKKDGAWLKSETDDVKKLKKGEVTDVIQALTHGEKERQGESGLSKVLSGMPDPSTEQVHVLGVVPKLSSVTSDWTSQPGAFAQVQLPVPNETSQFISIDAIYLQGSGLVEFVDSSTKSLLLFCREALWKQVTFLQQNAIQSDSLCWVVGPPGCGKSCAAFAFMMSLDPAEWNAVWIHYAKADRRFECVRFNESTKATLSFAQNEVVSQFRYLLSDLDANKKSIVFLDGYINWATVAEQAITECQDWRFKNRNLHRLVCVCSMVSRGKDSRLDLYKKLSDGRRWYPDQKEWVSWSWSANEYLEAVKSDDFFQSVKSMLGVDNEDGKLNVTRDTLVKNKFDVAGGNARFLFGNDNATVVELLKKAIEAAESIVAYTKGSVGSQSSVAINRLIKVDKDGKASILSRFVATELAIRFGPDMVLKLKEVLDKDLNPSTDGQFLEMWFFAKLMTWLKLLNREDSKPIMWSAEDTGIISLDPLKSRLDIPQGKECLWLRPIAWNQGGYDGVCMDNGQGLVRFVQVTCAKSHSFKGSFILDLLTKLKEKMSIRRVELAFVVPLEVLDSFQLLEKGVFVGDVIDSFVRQDAKRSDPSTMAEVECSVIVNGLDWKCVRPHDQEKKRRLED